MQPHLTALFRAVRQARRPRPDDLASSLQRLPAPGSLPSPWDAWTLLGLVRHRRRQLWVGDIITSRLQGSCLDLARMGAFGHPPIPQQGPVPGMPEWEYYFHGKGCCLTHRVRGEQIDVDFFDDSAEYFSLWFYQNYLTSLRDPEPPERRLLDLHPSVDPIRLSVESLLQEGALSPLPGRDSFPFRIADAVLEHEEDLLAFCGLWSGSGDRLWLAALIGDWPAAHEEAARGQDPTILTLTRERAEHCWSLRRQELLPAFRQQETASNALAALADLGAEDLGAVLREALHAPPSGLTSTALAILERLDQPAWCPEVFGLFSRLDPAGPIPQPHQWLRALQLLLRYGYRRIEVLAQLPRAGGSEIGVACLLALEHAPEHALPLIRRALCSGVPANRSTVAAILALIDRPWSRRELLAPLALWDDQEMTADCRAALLECRDEEAHRAVHAWEERNPHEPEAPTFVTVGGRQHGPCISLEEMMLRGRARWIRNEMEHLHDRVMRVRDVVPPEPPGQ